MNTRYKKHLEAFKNTVFPSSALVKDVKATVFIVRDDVKVVSSHMPMSRLAGLLINFSINSIVEKTYNII